MRLDPFYTPQAPFILGMALYMLEQYSQALPPLRDAVLCAPNFMFGHVFLAAAYAQLGRQEEAQAEAAEVLRLRPTYRIGRNRSLFKHPMDLENLLDGMRKAGLPEASLATSA
jgi:adenylate cyclase